VAKKGDSQAAVDCERNTNSTAFILVSRLFVLVAFYDSSPLEPTGITCFNIQ
jgi:hypothetical protein